MSLLPGKGETDWRVLQRVEQGVGGVEGNRTPDLLIANEALYQLSYNPALQGADNAQEAPIKSSVRTHIASPERRL